MNEQPAGGLVDVERLVQKLSFRADLEVRKYGLWGRVDAGDIVQEVVTALLRRAQAGSLDTFDVNVLARGLGATMVRHRVIDALRKTYNKETLAPPIGTTGPRLDRSVSAIMYRPPENSTIPTR